VLDLVCDQAGAANATPTTAARADSLRECFMAVSLVSEEVRPPRSRQRSSRAMRLSARPPCAYIRSAATATRRQARSPRRR
jgi:hypothetical protein